MITTAATITITAAIGYILGYYTRRSPSNIVLQVDGEVFYSLEEFLDRIYEPTPEEITSITTLQMGQHYVFNSSIIKRVR